MTNNTAFEKMKERMDHKHSKYYWSKSSNRPE